MLLSDTTNYYIISTIVLIVSYIVNFLFGVWDYLIGSVLGSVITVVQEIVKAAVKLMLIIMTKALTEDLSVITSYKNYVKTLFLCILNNAKFSTKFDLLENAFSGFKFEESINSLTNNVASFLGLMDSFCRI